MVVYEPYEKGGIQRVKAYSDKNMMIERDGIRYASADDFAWQERNYTETDEPIPPVPETDRERIEKLESQVSQNNADIEANAEAIQELAEIIGG